MSDASKYHGQINQALYFSRLLIEQAHAIEQAASGEGQFHRQQMQCFCEAALDAVYRAFYFLGHAELEDIRPGVDPSSWPQRLQQALQDKPDPFLREVLDAVQPGAALGQMLDAYTALWQVQVRRNSASELNVTEIHLSPFDCKRWHAALTALHARMHEQGAEY